MELLDIRDEWSNPIKKISYRDGDLTCGNGCIYCYANTSEISARRNQESHDPSSELLLGTILDGERITDRVVRSLRNDKLKLFKDIGE